MACLSQPAAGWDGRSGYVQDALKSDGLVSPASTAALLCGVKGMTEGVCERERARERARAREKESERERVFVREIESEREGERARASERARERESAT